MLLSHHLPAERSPGRGTLCPFSSLGPLSAGRYGWRVLWGPLRELLVGARQGVLVTAMEISSTLHQSPESSKAWGDTG